MKMLWEFTKRFLRVSNSHGVTTRCDEMTFDGHTIPKYLHPRGSLGESAADQLERFLGDFEDDLSMEDVLASSVEDYKDEHYLCGPLTYFS